MTPLGSMSRLSRLSNTTSHSLRLQLAPALLCRAHKHGKGRIPVCAIGPVATGAVAATGMPPRGAPLLRLSQEVEVAIGSSLDYSGTGLLTSWDQGENTESASSSVDAPVDSWNDVPMPGGGTSPSLLATGFATSKGPMKSGMQDYFAAVSDGLGALWALAPPEWQASRMLSCAYHQAAPFSLTAVFDGHGAGDHAARTAQESVLHAIASDERLLDCFVRNMEQPGIPPESLGSLAAAFRAVFHGLDDRICKEGALRALPLDGTTALVSVQVGPKLYTANAGDCRAVLCRDGRALRLSRDHKPELPDERQRIEAAGGRVANVRGTWRVVLPMADGCTAKVCAVSRGLGDRDFKAARLISATPDVAAVVLAPHRDAFVLHASDGLWGAVGDQEAVDCAAAVIQSFSAMTSLTQQRAAAAKAAAQQLVRLARDRGSLDDITVVVTLFDWE